MKNPLIFMVKRLVLFILILCSNSSYSQDKKIDKDSIINLINLPKDISKQKRDSLILRGLTLSKENNFDSLSFVFASKYARNAALEYDSVNYQKGLKELQELYKTKKTDNFLASYNYSKGIYHHYNSKLDSSFYYLLKAKNYYLEHNYKKYAGYVFLELLSVQLDVNDRIGLEKTVVEALIFFKKNPDYYRIASTYQYQAISIGDFDLERANKYFDKAIYYTDSISDNYLKEATALYIQINKGYALLGNKKFKEALEEIKKGIELYKKSNYKENFEEDYYWLLINQTASQMGLGNTEEVYSKLDSILQFTNKTNDSYAQGTLFLGFAEYHFAKGNKQQGIDYLKKSLELCKKTNNTSVYIDALRLLAEKTNGNTSRKLLKELIHLKDSLYKKERKEKDQYALVKFETEQKEAENSQLKQENILNKANLKNERQRSNIIALGALLSLLIAGFIYYIYAARKKEFAYKTNLEKAKAREQERIDIAADLHDKVVGDLRIIHKKTLQLNADEISTSLNSVNQEIRNISHKLSSVDFDEVTFKDQIINLVTDYFKPKFRIKVTNIDAIDWSNINNQIKRALFLVIREAIQNSKKHAEATKIKVNFVEKSKNIQLQISDNGKGFDVQSPKLGIGLKNQKRRVEELNGVFVLESILNAGTTTTINIPIIV